MNVSNYSNRVKDIKNRNIYLWWQNNKRRNDRWIFEFKNISLKVT